MPKVILCKTTNTFIDYEGYNPAYCSIEESEFSEVSDEDFKLLRSYVKKLDNIVLLTLLPKLSIKEAVEKERKCRLKEEEQRKKASIKRRQAKKEREVRKKTKQISDAASLLRKEGYAVDLDDR